VELNLQALERIMETRYDKYILAHNGVCDDIRELARQNRDNLLEKAELTRSLIDGPITKDELVIRFVQATGKDLNSPRRVHGIHYNISSLLTYLLDSGRLEERIQGGITQYIPAGYQD
jgi:hypothetical protein